MKEWLTLDKTAPVGLRMCSVQPSKLLSAFVSKEVAAPGTKTWVLGPKDLALTLAQSLTSWMTLTSVSALLNRGKQYLLLRIVVRT